MTAQPTGAVADRADEARGAVPQDEGAAPSTVENGEAVALPSVGGLLRGVAVPLGQVRPVGREAARPAGDRARIVRGTHEHLPSPEDERFADPAWSEAWATWVLERSGAEVAAPATLGSDRHPPLDAAPYVLDRVP